MKIDDLTFNSMYCVLQSGMWLLNDLEAFLKPRGMTQARLSILLAVMNSPDGTIHPNDIARITGKSRPGITRTIERLTEQGMLAVAADAGDGRKKRLSLTDKAHEMLNSLIPEYNRRISDMSADFTDSEKVQLIKLLAKINFLDTEKQLGSIL